MANVLRTTAVKPRRPPPPAHTASWIQFALLALACLVLATASGPATAGVAASAEAGRGESVDIWGVGIAWTDIDLWHLSHSTDVALWALGRVDHWHGVEPNAVVSDLWDVSATPVLRLQPADLAGVSPFLDVGIGVHLITETRINANRVFSTVFQFGELLGVGLRFGDHGRYEISFRIQHVSNDDIKEPNNGLSFRTVAIQYRF